MAPKLLIFISIFVFSFIIITSIIQGYYTCSDMLFMCFIYSSVLVIFYFSYGIKMEKTVVTKQIQTFTNETFQILDSKFNIKPTKKINLDDLNKNNSDSNNIEIITANKKLKIDIIKIIISSTVIATLLSIFIWVINNKNDKNYNFKDYKKNIISKNLILIIFVVLVQFTFSTIIIKNTLPFKTKEIIKIILSSLIEN